MYFMSILLGVIQVLLKTRGVLIGSSPRKESFASAHRGTITNNAPYLCAPWAVSSINFERADESLGVESGAGMIHTRDGLRLNQSAGLSSGLQIRLLILHGILLSLPNFDTHAQGCGAETLKRD